MSESAVKLLCTAVGWCGGVTVTICALALIYRRPRAALVFGGLSVPLGMGALYVIFA